jgi:hypothetical protein
VGAGGGRGASAVLGSGPDRLSALFNAWESGD